MGSFAMEHQVDMSKRPLMLAKTAYSYGGSAVIAEGRKSKKTLPRERGE